MSEVSSEILPQGTCTSSSENDCSSVDNITPPPPPSPQQKFEKYEVKVNKIVKEQQHLNPKEQKRQKRNRRSNSITTPSDSPDEEEDADSRSISTRSNDSGCGKSCKEEYNSKRGESVIGNKSGKSLHLSQVDLDTSSSLLWGASLLYYTGLPSPRIKEHHFASSSSLSPSPPSLYKKSLFGRKPRSSLSLASDDTMERPRSPFKNIKKFYTLPRKSPSKDSGNESSVITDISTGSGTQGDVPEGENNDMLHSDSMSPLRRRHLSCMSPTEKESRFDVLKSKIKGNASSLRLLKVTRPSLPSFMEKTQSLPRSSSSNDKNKIREQGNFIAASCSTASLNDDNDELKPHDVEASTMASSTASTSGSSGFKSAKKAIRNSFKAARNLLPMSSKISPTAKASENLKKNSSSKRDSPCKDQTNDTDEPRFANCSAPNTPAVIKKSRLERARKKFTSTLSLHTGSSSCGGGGGRSKSISTLVISDSDINPSISYGTSDPDHKYPARGSSKSADNLFEERAIDVLAVVEDPMPSSIHNSDTFPSQASKNTKKVGTKSPFRFMGRSKNKIDGKCEENSEKEEFESGKEIKNESIRRETKTKEAIQLGEIKPESVVADGSKEKPNKKRTSIMKSIGKAIRTGRGSKEASTEQTLIDSKTQTLTSTSEQDSLAEGSRNKTPEILKFENEPRVRTPKVPRRQRLNSASGSGSASTTSSSVTYTPTKAQDTLNINRSNSSQVEDKDREIHELEVSETSIDFSPRKLFHLTKTSSIESSRERKGQSHQNDNNDNDCHMRDVDQRYYDPRKKGTSPSGPLDSGESSKSLSLAGTINFSKRKSCEDKVEDKTKKKSQSLITSLVTSSSSGKKSSEKSNMDEKKKRKNAKKASKKKLIGAVSQETPESKAAAGDGQTKSSINDASSNNNNTNATKNGETHETVEIVQNGNDKEEEPTLSSSPGENNIRKSSDDYKDLRKNAIKSSRASFAGTTEKTEAEGGKEEIRRKSSSDTKLDLDEGEVSCSSIREKFGGDDYGGGGDGSGSKSLLNGTVNAARDQNAKSSSYFGHNKLDTAIDDDDSEIIRFPQPAQRNEFDENDDEKESEAGVAEETDDPDTACTQSFRQLQPFTFNLAPVEQGKKERLYKVLVVGELGTGKTSIIKRYVHQFFSQHYRATIGVDFALKVLRWDPDTVVRLQLWDIAGQERFGSMTRVYYKEAVGAFVVFDVTRSATLEAVPKWKADLDNKVVLPDGRPIPTVLLANKSDQPKEGIAASREKMNDFCQQQGFSAWFETSAKDNINIDESANFLVSKILEMDKWSQEPLAPDPDKLDLTANGKHKGSSASNCAC